tara:strand:+ start:2622 stop:4463 length:1842 start_codon:yes stop_codon:yes gene_type:complete
MTEIKATAPEDAATSHTLNSTPEECREFIQHCSKQLSKGNDPLVDIPTTALDDVSNEDYEYIGGLAIDAQEEELPHEAFLESLPQEYVEAAFSTEPVRWLPTMPNDPDRAFMTAYEIMSDCETPIEPFENQYGTPHIKIGSDVLMLDSERAERRVKALCTQFGKAAASASQNFLDALSSFGMPDIPNGPARRTVHKRSAFVDGKLYINLAQSGNRSVVEIDEFGFRVIDCPEHILFMMFDGADVALPTPIPGGSVSDLQELWRTEDPKNIQLLLSAAASYLLPTGPYAILSFVGTMGSGKTTAARQLRSLVDPRDNGGMLSQPEKQDDLYETAASMWLLAFDNVEVIPAWMSNSLCQIREGATDVRRTFYKQGRVRLTHALNPIIMTSVNPVTAKSDLEDRTITITFRSRVDESTETDATIRSRWEEIRPQILGLLCEALSMHLRRRGKISMSKRPRNAEFAQLAVEIAPALGWTEQEAESQLFENVHQAHMKILENSVVYEPLKELLMSQPNGEWQGIMKDLLHLLSLGRLEEDPFIKWSRRDREEGSPERLSKEIRFITNSWALTEGFVYEERNSREKGRERFLKLPSQPSQPSQDDDSSDSSDSTNGGLF